MATAERANLMDPAPEQTGTALELKRLFLQKGTAMGAATALQRALSFFATALAARIAGPANFGAYSTALATAGMVAGYMGLGIGNSASRYIGMFPRDALGYRKTICVISIITGLCGISGATVLFLGAETIADLVLANKNFQAILQVGALAALAIILYEALNGVALGLLNIRGFCWLSLGSGTAMVVAMTLTSRHGAEAMLLGHAAALGFGMVIAAFLSRAFLKPLPSLERNGRGVRARDVVFFGLTHVGTSAWLAAASWAVTALVARSDSTLHEMGYYWVGNQLRVCVAMLPGFVTQLVLPVLARLPKGTQGEEEVVYTATLLTALLSVAIAGLMLLGLSWILHIYGPAYANAIEVAPLLIATAVIHMVGVPASHYLMTVDLRLAAAVNFLGSGVLVLLALLLVPKWGATGAGSAWLLMQGIAAVLTYGALKLRGSLPEGIFVVWIGPGIAAILMASLHGTLFAIPLGAATASLLQVILWVGTLAFLLNKDDGSAFLGFQSLKQLSSAKAWKMARSFASHFRNRRDWLRNFRL